MSTITGQRRTGAGTHVRQIEVPVAARGLSTLERIDYEDAFIVDPAPSPDPDPSRDRSAERWARATLEDTPATVRAKLLCGWSALGLRLGSPWSATRVLGWRIRRSDPDVVLLGAGGWFGLSGELLFRREPDRLLFCTFVKLRNPVVRMVWARIEATHQEVVPSLLRHAALRLAGSAGA